MTVSITDVHSLPIFPTSKVLRSLAPSLQATVLDHIASALLQALSLSDQQLSKLSCADFISSYVTDGSIDVLNALVFPEERLPWESKQEKEIRKRVFALAHRLAGLPKAGGLDLQALLDICIVYGPRNMLKTRKLMETAFKSHPVLLNDLEWSIVPAFMQTVLSSDSGLHVLRKTLFCISSFIQCSPPDAVTIFSKSKDFVLALANCYDMRLSAIAAGYGGISLDRPDETGTSSLWVQCKVAIIDTFHIVLQNILENVKENPHANAESAFDLVFSLLRLPSTSTQHDPSQETPFLNRPLIADYQEVYSLSSTLHSVLSNNDDPRLDVLSSTLKSFESNGDKSGALKLILRSSGAAPNIDLQGYGNAKVSETKSVPQPTSSTINDVDLEIATTSVMDILPDYETTYIRSLLKLPQYDGNAESVIAALLEGTAPPPGSATLSNPSPNKPLDTVLPPPREEPRIERRSVFNEQFIDASKVNVGKRRDDTNLGDKSFIEQVKADILRRAAELSDSEEEEVEIDEYGKKVRIAAFAEEDDGLDNNVRVAGDGEATSDDEDTDPVEETSIDTILELAYINDPKVFDRDANTRRSKARADLKVRTNWSDEQLEGWRIMLERNPKKDKILLKHEFSGNVVTSNVNNAGPSTAGHEGARGPNEQRGSRGRGRGGGGGGRGRGRGGRGGGQGGGDDARERAWKDKNKARQANHNRKRGHDRKLARGGAIPGPSI